MNFLEALKLAEKVISEQRDGLDEIYLYERISQSRVLLTDCEGSLEFTSDESLAEQIYLASFLDKRLRSTNLSLAVIFSDDWEVRLRKTQHLKAVLERGETKEKFLDFAPVGKAD